MITKAIKIIIGVILPIFILTIFLSFKLKTLSKEVGVTTITPVTVQVITNRTVKGDFWWKLPAGQYINGRNEIADNERLVKVEERDNSHFYLSQEYMEYGRPETMWIRLRNIGNNTWDGPWKQDNPDCHGRMTLEEVAPGIYSGERTWSTGEKARCHIKLN